MIYICQNYYKSCFNVSLKNKYPFRKNPEFWKKKTLEELVDFFVRLEFSLRERMLHTPEHVVVRRRHIKRIRWMR